ncbi:MAG: amino acid adenylation domain-containing protein [Coriobacteriales bacterium]|nr:amino acid adenylation domain-containing protein [Coriobacteriales bacterium]
MQSSDFQSIAGAYRAQAQATPEAIALSDERCQLTFKELDLLSDLIAAEIGWEHRGECIGLVLDHTVMLIAAILAVLKTGAAYVPAEPSFPAERIRNMMAQSDSTLSITQHEYADLFESGPLYFLGPEKLLAKMRRIADGSDADAASELELTAAPADASAADRAYILYTSGSTGAPKGVQISQGNVLHYVNAFAHEFAPGPADVMLQYSVCSFDIFTEEVFPVLLHGGSLAIPGPQSKADFARLLDFITAYGVTIVTGFPYFIREFNASEVATDLPRSLRLLISGGDVVRASYVDRLVGRIAVYNTYGPSETTVCCSYFHCRPDTELEDGSYPVGRPILGTEIKVMDNAGHEVPAGDAGEIYIYGGGVGLGYVGNPASATAFKEAADGSRFYTSGDLGYLLPDGNLAFLRRADAQVMILGRRVEPGEVAAVIERHPAVREAVVCAHFDAANLAYLTAYVVAEDADTPLDVVALRSHAASYLAAFMVPEFFVQLAELPKGSSGKVDLKALPLVLREPQI